MKILVLGGGNGQLGIIKKAKTMGHQVIVSDYYEDAPAKKFADFSELISTFDVESNLRAAKKHNVDAVLTAGTDQPVYTAAAVNNALGLPSFLDLKTAKAVTNKKIMKTKFLEADIAAVKHKIIDENFNDKTLSDLTFPVVVKPLDSQGQRGIFKLKNTAQIRKNFSDVLKFSREKEILVEEYYQSEEITLSGWVKDSKLKILTITDRITHQNKKHIGICSAHIFPSKFLNIYYQDIKRISQKIVNTFEIKNGPVYFQLLIGEQGIKVNEIACRIGGAYEGDFIPIITGVDIMKMMINLSLGNNPTEEELDKYDILKNKKWLSVQLFFAETAEIREITPLFDLKELPGVIDAGLNFKAGDKIGEIENASERAGYFIVKADSKKELKMRIKKAYDTLKIYNFKGENIIIREIGEVI
ncbi:MAG: ATP-grasp domain-containing protein [Bacillota bacterium]